MSKYNERMDRYVSWPDKLQSIAKKQQKQKQRQQKLVSHQTDGISRTMSAAATSQSIVDRKQYSDEAVQSFATYLGVNVDNASSQDTFLIKTIPQLLDVLSDDYEQVPDAQPLPLSKEELKHELLHKTAVTIQERNLNPNSWPLVIQICASILYAGDVNNMVRKKVERVNLMTEVCKIVIAQVWSSQIFPFIAVVHLCLRAVISIYVDLHGSRNDSSILWTLCCMPPQQQPQQLIINNGNNIISAEIKETITQGIIQE